MTNVSNNHIAEALYLALKSKDKSEQDNLLKNVAQYFIKNRLTSKIPDILRRLEKIINKHEARVVARVSSREPLLTSVNQELAEILMSRYNAKNVDLIENIDPNVLGGFKIEIGDEVIDLTVKNKIIKLQEHLMKSA
jgi:F-type H+-transporting ATPase subunit delta